MTKKIILIELYYSLLKENSFFHLLQEKGYTVIPYSFFKEEKKRFINKIEYVFREVLCLFKLLFKLHSFRNTKVYCLGGYYATLFMCKLFSPFLGKDFRLYIYNFYLHKAGESKKVQAILRFLFNNQKCILIVQSPLEVEYYGKLVNIPIHFVPYCADIKPANLSRRISLPTEEYIFTGGYTNRDYALVIKCARQLPMQKFLIVASSLNTDIDEKELPPNISLIREIDKEEFDLFLYYSHAVIIPLKSNVGSSGQMLCLSAMQNRKPIVYCDISSINYYFEKNISGIPYYLGDEVSLLDGISRIIENKKTQKELGENAYMQYLRHFTLSHRDNLLFQIINDKN